MKTKILQITIVGETVQMPLKDWKAIVKYLEKGGHYLEHAKTGEILTAEMRAKTKRSPKNNSLRLVKDQG